jgi:predicted site-specific integrase-resolvase
VSEPPPYLTVEQYAQHRSVSERTMWSWIQKGLVPVVRTGARIVRIQTSHADFLLDTPDPPKNKRSRRSCK